MTDYAWTHIMKKHPMMFKYFEEMQHTLRNPTVITTSIIDESVHYYYLYLKNKEGSNKYLFISVKYLNGEGYVISSYFEDKIT